ncbi:hypothetical protein [Microlunatus soli]|uniref:Asp23 family, cell envelope-related function n=1 Tax=Microlunatus soli TaxID=630515 RepID=A0A1H1XEC6_9ACTN|nr:hypothetical protein [Microlunatus soli]SDT07608.1 hypothetical protein SAMN04489812_4048 [Microlunatus soli]
MTTDPRDPQLAARLESLILAVDGVDRLQPTLRRAVASITADAVRRATPAVARLVRPGIPGLDIRPRRDGSVDVSVDLTTNHDGSALAVGRAVRRAVRDALRQSGLEPGVVAVTVLEVVADRPSDSGVTRE